MYMEKINKKSCKDGEGYFTKKELQENKHKPLQRKELPTGNREFVDLAVKMGKKYQIDTSPLQANHNSSFPSQVGAVATLQGNKVDFLPGQDTKYNMKHEIGHFIINAKRGTPPKTDTVLNGHAINTSDEVAADTIADSSI